MPAMSEVGSVSSDVGDDEIVAARAALARHSWQEAYDHYHAADAARPLSGLELEGLAEAAFFVARADEEASARERAFKVYETSGDTQRAAFIALNLTRSYGYQGKHAISSVWLKRAERLIGPGGDTYVDGYLAVVRSEIAKAMGDIDRALELAEEAIAISEGAADADLRAHALSNLGELKIASGATTDGMALMEEATMSAVNGELTPFASGVTACRTIGACRNLTDYQRATEWIEATERYCERQSLSGFPGICRIHRAEVAAVGGAWERAEEELERATHELDGYNAVPPQADGHYAIGDIRRLRGDFEGAETALLKAHEGGRTPQPAMALIRLAQGHTKGAATMLDAALAETTTDQWARARLLPARAEIAIAAGDVTTARAVADELGAIVAGYPSPALEAGRQVVLGRVLLAEGDGPGAVRELRSGARRWREVGAPYDVARARFVLSQALRLVQDEEDADLELRSALDEFGRLGAKTDIKLIEDETRSVEERRSAPLAARMTFMFTDIVNSTNTAEALGDEAWGRLLRWHDDSIRAIIGRHRGDVVKSTGDGFFAAFDSARSAIEAAVGIQVALREHRDTSGFALPVRIGLHTADANRRGSDYSGTGVHVAARVAAQAGAGEILASTDTIAEAGDAAGRTGTPTPTMLKGVSKPVDLVSIGWA